jgi:quercetin dioxygenase-like cupin family protein
MIVRLGEQEDRFEERNPVAMRPLLGRERDVEALSMTWIQISGRHARLRTDEADRTYVVVAGQGHFQLGDEPVESVGTGDVVFIPRGVPYEFDGHFTYLVINTPAFREGSDIYLE